MRESDLEVNRDIRRILVRHWIDLGRLSFRCVNGKAFVHGTLSRIFGAAGELTASIVENIFSDIRRISGVKGLHVQLDNWLYEHGRCMPLGEAKSSKASAEGVTTKDAQRFVIKTKGHEQHGSGSGP